MDDFLYQHFRKWADSMLNDDEGKHFESWILKRFQDDADFVSVAGWPMLYEMFIVELRISIA